MKQKIKEIVFIGVAFMGLLLMGADVDLSQVSFLWFVIEKLIGCCLFVLGFYFAGAFKKHNQNQ